MSWGKGIDIVGTSALTTKSSKLGFGISTVNRTQLGERQDPLWFWNRFQVHMGRELMYLLGRCHSRLMTRWCYLQRLGLSYVCHLTQFLLISGVDWEERKLIYGLHLLSGTSPTLLYWRICPDSCFKGMLQQREAQLWLVSHDFSLICLILICSQDIKK